MNMGSPAPTVLSQLGHELHAVADKTSELQEALSHVLHDAERGQGVDLYALQNIDHVTQTLSCLASFLKDLASSASEDWSLDTTEAAKNILLLDLAARLTSQQHPRQQTLADITTGDCTLF